MTKLYKAIDKADGKVSAFMVRNNGDVCKSCWTQSDKVEIEMAKASEHLQGACPNGMNDAIDPVLIAEW